MDFLCGLTTDLTPARQLAKELADSTTRVRDLEEQRAVRRRRGRRRRLPRSVRAGRRRGRRRRRRPRADHRPRQVPARMAIAPRPRPPASAASSRSSGSRWSRPWSTGARSSLNQVSRRRRVRRIFVVRTDDGLVVKRAERTALAPGSSSATTRTRRPGPRCRGAPDDRAGDRRGQVGRADVPVRSDSMNHGVR